MCDKCEYKIGKTITIDKTRILDAIWILKDLVERLEDDIISTYEIKKAISIIDDSI